MQIKIFGVNYAVKVVYSNIKTPELNLNNNHIEIKLPNKLAQKNNKKTIEVILNKMYQKILENDNVTAEQKNIAQQEITKVNELKNSIMIAENLIKTKGFEDLIIFVNNKSVNIIVKSNELKTEQIAQIQNITSRELGVEIDNIHISNKNNL